MLKTKEEIIDWLDKYNIINYTINEDLTVDVADNVNLYNKELTSIGVNFNNIYGNFNCGENKLKSLKGSPKVVTLDFICINNNLENLEFMPEKVGRYFGCNKNQLLKELQYITNFNYIKTILNKEKLERILIEAIKNKEALDLILIDKNIKPKIKI